MKSSGKPLQIYGQMFRIVHIGATFGNIKRFNSSHLYTIVSFKTSTNILLLKMQWEEPVELVNVMSSWRPLYICSAASGQCSKWNWDSNIWLVPKKGAVINRRLFLLIPLVNLLFFYQVKELNLVPVGFLTVTHTSDFSLTLLNCIKKLRLFWNSASVLTSSNF